MHNSFCPVHVAPKDISELFLDKTSETHQVLFVKQLPTTWTILTANTTTFACTHTVQSFTQVLNGWMADQTNQEREESFMNLKFKVCSLFRKWASAKYSVNNFQGEHLKCKSFWTHGWGFFSAIPFFPFKDTHVMFPFFFNPTWGKRNKMYLSPSVFVLKPVLSRMTIS